jgi:hypothetical protein
MNDKADLSQKRRAASLARKKFAAGTGRPRSNNPRCRCGMMTAKRAAARGHRC